MASPFRTGSVSTATPMHGPSPTTPSGSQPGPQDRQDFAQPAQKNDMAGTKTPMRARGILPGQPTPQAGWSQTRPSKAAAALSQSYHQQQSFMSPYSRATSHQKQPHQHRTSINDIVHPSPSPAVARLGPVSAQDHSLSDIPPTEPLLKHRGAQGQRSAWYVPPSDEDGSRMHDTDTHDAGPSVDVGLMPRAPTAGLGGQDAGVDYADEHKHWVTVYGFYSAQLDFVLERFRQYGDIVMKAVAPRGGNWIHLRYQSALQAQVALSKHENVWQADTPMKIGVAMCTDKSVMGIYQGGSDVDRKVYATHGDRGGDGVQAAPGHGLADVVPQKLTTSATWYNYLLGW